MLLDIVCMCVVYFADQLAIINAVYVSFHKKIIIENKNSKNAVKMQLTSNITLSEKFLLSDQV